MRKDIIDIVNKLATLGTLDFDLFKCYNTILNYCKETKTKPNNNNYTLVTGMLQINGKNTKRVDSLPKKIDFDEKAYYLEGRILARQEIADM
jgi:hypothetical protein